MISEIVITYARTQSITYVIYEVLLCAFIREKYFVRNCEQLGETYFLLLETHHVINTIIRDVSNQLQVKFNVLNSMLSSEYIYIYTNNVINLNNNRKIS